MASRILAALSPVRVLVLGFICLGLGCAQATSNMAGWYVTRKLDQTFDLTRPQKKHVRERVDTLITRARRDDLPKLLHLMREVRDAIDHDDVEARFDALQKASDQWLDRVALALIPELAALLDTLSKPQIAHFEGRMGEYLEEIYADQHMPPSERRKKLSASLVAGLEKTVGRLSESQAHSIESVARTLPDDREDRYRESKARLSEAARFFNSRPGRDAIEAELTRLWRTRNDGGMGPERRRQAHRTLLLSVDKSLTRTQRTHAVEKLGEQIRFLKRFLVSESQ